jgi:RHS repeat-associated protein
LLTGRGVDQYLTRTDSAGTSNYLSDALGSTVALTDSTGTVQTSYSYEPYGNVTSSGSSSRNSYQFTGRENDGTGLDYYRARYYNPVFQRFASEDPLRFGAGDSNLYSYSSDSPTDLKDPSGQFVQILVAAATGCVVGATVAGFIDDIKLMNAARKGRPPDVDEQKYSSDLIRGCVVGAIFGVAGALVAAVFVMGAGAEGAAVFWSGPGAEAAATEWAAANAARTVGMTATGLIVKALTDGIPWVIARPLWVAASKAFAESASGDANVFQSAAGISIDSIWAEVEWPALLDNPYIGKIVFHIVGGG